MRFKSKMMNLTQTPAIREDLKLTGHVRNCHMNFKTETERKRNRKRKTERLC